MIRKVYGGPERELVCDICGESAAEIFSGFDDAVDYKRNRANGWHSEQDMLGTWYDICPECDVRDMEDAWED